MDFVKTLLLIQHEQTLQQVSDKLLNDNFEKEQFIKKHNKKNYCSIKVSNCKMKSIDCVKINELLSILDM